MEKSGVDLSSLLHTPELPEGSSRYCTKQQNHGLEETLDMTQLLKLAAPALERGEAVSARLPICNVNRATGDDRGQRNHPPLWTAGTA
ncbi:hypothetical protein HMSSN139_44130 [Paenibacillus sp. HMSSN-139]|nr:hypothetical protein HMSSN139_44130 [Paenibacillus sp. HMSSN-139]